MYNGILDDFLKKKRRNAPTVRAAVAVLADYFSFLYPAMLLIPLRLSKIDRFAGIGSGSVTDDVTSEPSAAITAQSKFRARTEIRTLFREAVRMRFLGQFRLRGAD